MGRCEDVRMEGCEDDKMTRVDVNMHGCEKQEEEEDIKTTR